VTPLTVSPDPLWQSPLTELKKGASMKTVLAATLVLFSISTTSFAFEAPNIDGIEGIQQMIKGKGGKRSQRAQQQQDDEGQGQQSRRGGGMQGMMKGLMNGDTSGLQGLMSSFGQ
jgi:hypothetical protein